MSAEYAVATMMTEREARACVDCIRAGLEDIRKDVLELYDREGWRALGYASWRECVVAEFGQSERELYRALEAGQVERVLTNLSDESIHIKESHAHAIASLAKSDPEAARAVWREVNEEAEREQRPVTAAKVSEAVQRVRRVPEPDYIEAEYVEREPDPRIWDLKAAIQLLEPMYRDYSDYHAPTIRAHTAALRNVLRQMQEGTGGI